MHYVSECPHKYSNTNVCVCVQLQAHLDSAQRQHRTEQDLNMAIQNKSAQLEEEQKR